MVAAGRVQARELRPINVRHALKPTPVTRQPSHAAVSVLPENHSNNRLLDV